MTKHQENSLSTPNLQTALVGTLRRELRGRPVRESVPSLKRFIESCKELACSKCGNTYPPRCMDFKHTKEAKKFYLGSALREKRTLSEILDEIAKCEVVCANCGRLGPHPFVPPGGRPRICLDQYAAIKEAYRVQRSMRRVGHQFGISPNTVMRICHL